MVPGMPYLGFLLIAPCLSLLAWKNVQHFGVSDQPTRSDIGVKCDELQHLNSIDPRVCIGCLVSRRLGMPHATDAPP